MGGHGSKCLKMAEKSFFERLKMAENYWTWLNMAQHASKWLETAECLTIAYNPKK